MLNQINNNTKQGQEIKYAAEQWFNILLMDIKSKQTIAVVQTKKRQENNSSKSYSLKV